MTMPQGSSGRLCMREEDPPAIAAFLNGIVVMFGPALAAMMWPATSSNSVTVRPPGASDPMVGIMLMVAAIMSPLAAVAGWRTWVHAKRRRDRGTLGLRGIAEAGLLGFSIVFIPIFVAVASHLSERPGLTIGYAAFYAGIGLVVGLVFGCVLWVFATIVLAVCGRLTISSP
jgi:hypothetical protein